MPLKTRYNLLLGSIIVVLCLVIINYERKLNLKDESYRNDINSNTIRSTAREAALENKVEICNQSYLLYLQKSEKEYRDLLFEAKKLKEKINENAN